ncbi:MAG TPA: ATP-grasp domain-containing protein [Polyangiaceae bacterium LLY-WYZ-15_(1-7)]|nr:biotin carboxylase [Myxococcales bacterium]MBJ71537.1 biotin carboxylase [Sandaracinus sp.]HJK89820.1 ATP-grasp domain-containing protein [Polyangiaceae bacterium LLY-WYZ-15_(1-7)]HJL00867.1 ATP-grasp domain-containing protein [Polyangiaceae bacterium LLY-WYZ-15_(1-7)]HJL10974.1 ATP-grasp domain-containing protein [Polyangiaceae bacterium LLY-WYZ-15_(1-7)]
MSSRDPSRPTIAVTAMNATDNPGPGISVSRALKHDPDFQPRVVGLAYDALEPGIYHRDVIDDAFLIPYPSQGLDALAERIAYVHERVGGLDAIVPTLDSELASFIALEPRLRELGIGTFLPSREQLDLRSKTHLSAMGREAGIPVPKEKVLSDVRDLYTMHETIPYPFVVKGVYYGASIVRSIDEALAAFHRQVARWGYPVIVQQFVAGEEYDVVAVGDGKGGLVGAVPMKKTYLTDKGKGWAGIAIGDPELMAITERFMKHSRWRGPCEVEVIKSVDPKTDEETYYLLEINPRFPAWTYLSAGAGMNLPRAVAKLAMGEAVEPLRDYRVGTMFVRISLDQIATLETLQQITTAGEIVAEPTPDAADTPAYDTPANDPKTTAATTTAANDGETP